jgi:O-antigen/teichoic acid export membrane protein
VLAASAAGAGALLAQKFGRNARTDGFLAAYQIYIVLSVAAQSFRMVVLPELTRAAETGRLGEELRAYATAFLLLAVPASVACGLLARPIGDAVTGSLPHVAASEAAHAVVWLVPAAFAQLFAGLCASALAALDSYGTAAAGYAAGGIAGLALFAAFASSHGLVALAWGLALNAAVAAAVPLVRLVRAGAVGRGKHAPTAAGARLWLLVRGSTLPVALQAFTLVGLRLLANLGVGRVTSFSYAYLLAATLVASTSFALSLISSAPLTRRGFDPEDAAEHVVHSSWLSLAIAGAATGVIALVGGPIFGFVLGHQYRGIGRIFLELTPWLVAATAYYASFPLLFVAGKLRLLVPVALLAVAVDVPLALGFRNLWGMAGVAASLAVVTALVALALMFDLSPRLLVRATAGLLRLAALVAALAAVCFVLPWLALPSGVAAAVGLVLYAGALLALRRHGLEAAWEYVRALH